MMRSQNANPLLMSASKPNVGRTPLNNVRRGSMWPGAGGTIQQQGAQASAKDPRPLREKSYQALMRRDIIDYLKNAGTDITSATLANITAKDFRQIFNFLILSLDPSYPFTPGARLEEEFVPALKAQRYPYAHTISNNWLAAPASMHSWPSLLGVLHWLVELCKLKEHYLKSSHPTLQIPSNIPDEFDSIHEHRALAFDFFEKSYTLWLDGADDFPEPTQELEDRYARKIQSIQAELDEISNESVSAREQLKELRASADPIAKLLEQNKLLKSDSVKMRGILDLKAKKKTKLQNEIMDLKASLMKKESDLEQLHAEHGKLTGIVRTQNLSPEEVHQMNTSYETLSRNTEELKQKLLEAQRYVHSSEIAVTHRSTAAEEALDAYIDLVANLDLFPPLQPPWEHIDLSLQLNTATSDVRDLLSGADVNEIVLPTLEDIAARKRSERASLENQKIKLDDELERVTLTCENLDDENSQLQNKADAINEQADNLRDAAQQEAYEASRQASQLERDLAHARTVALANGMGVKSKLQALQISYTEQVEKVDRLKKQTIHAILKSGEDIADLKKEVSQHLNEMREYAETD
ncbi:HEC/Ndc80p family-domain-containing protein [Schizophyllum amplum]|uniref:Kinetochore protein NDC80 n=1 Tax=Schizophyllum amplum TaxID=97359 RepID=A0A550CAA9_9AGAR|nr:HEC/Ndc80p family-domain-containing protein [Auriculariopsis ampla]